MPRPNPILVPDGKDYSELGYLEAKYIESIGDEKFKTMLKEAQDRIIQQCLDPASYWFPKKKIKSRD